MNETKALTLAQLNGRLFTTLMNVLNKSSLDIVRVYYKKDCIIVNIFNNVYTISSEKDIIKFKEDIKFLIK